MTAVLDDLELLLSSAPPETEAVYSRLAARYEHFRTLWLHLAGGSVERAMFDDLATLLTPTTRVLDAGSGTGPLARRIHALQPDAELILLDLVPAMLAQAADVPGERIVASVQDIPLPDESVDIEVSGWTIETVADPFAAVSEYLRVIKPDGYVLYTFCSLPNGWASRTGTALLRAIIENRFAGNFLATEETPWHDCERSRRVRSLSGLTTYVLLRKCCAVKGAILPPVDGATRYEAVAIASIEGVGGTPQAKESPAWI